MKPSEEEPLDFGHPREALTNHASVGTGSAKGGLCLGLFGLPFAAAGVGAILVYTGHLPGHVNGPKWIMAAVGAVFGAVGFSLVIAGVRSQIREAQIKRDFVRHADEPWKLDRWKSEEYAADLTPGILSSFAMATFLTLFMLPFNYFAFFTKKSEYFLMAFMGLFDLFLLAAWGYAVYVLLRKIKYHDGKLRLREFPCLVQNPVRLTLHLPRAVQGHFERLECTFRICEQAWESHGDSNSLVTYQVYSEERSFGGGEVQREVPLEFDLPKGAPGTRLHGDRAVFYELEAKAETPGVDYRAIYLLPVYV
jgi:hypothetical protein